MSYRQARLVFLQKRLEAVIVVLIHDDNVESVIGLDNQRIKKPLSSLGSPSSSDDERHTSWASFKYLHTVQAGKTL